MRMYNSWPCNNLELPLIYYNADILSEFNLLYTSKKTNKDQDYDITAVYIIALLLKTSKTLQAEKNRRLVLT